MAMCKCGAMPKYSVQISVTSRTSKSGWEKMFAESITKNYCEDCMQKFKEKI